MKLTVFHDGQFWVGVVEEIIHGKLKAARYVFGPEPYDWDVLHFVNHHMLACISQASSSVAVKVPVRPANPKRLAREAAKEMQQIHVSTFAQEAMKQDREAFKLAHKTVCKQVRNEQEEAKWEKKVQKAKEKRRGH